MSRNTVLNNFIEKYGIKALGRLIEGLEQGVSGSILAAELGVTRERVRQWKELFGTSVQVYTVYTDVAAIVRAPTLEVKVMTEDYFVQCREGKEREDGKLLVLPLGAEGEPDTWELWEPCGQASGQASMIRGEDGDRVYRGKWYRCSFRGSKESLP